MAGTIRVIQADEQVRLQEIGALTALAYLSDALVDNAHPYIPALRDAHARAEKAILLAMADGERGEGAIVGTLTVVPPGSPFIERAGSGEFELRMLAVSPMERGRGIGAELTLYGVKLAQEQGATGIVLSTMETMHAAHRLYERLGFVRRTDLDWVVQDNPDGTVTPVDHAPDASAGEVRLLGYSWDMTRTV
ncbi:MAG: GNAT family N-acetyltransferase [Demequina sp.]|jgi:GNAT superfamily N-acetyltransferase|nr:GNAT family N-acetyltransferase [Demequina sp.]